MKYTSLISTKIKVYKPIMCELFLNIFAFSLITIAQQIIAFPILSRFYDSAQLGLIILIFGISNILTSMLGFSIGSARLLDNYSYNIKFIKLLNVSNVFIFFIGLFVYNFLFYEHFLNSILFSIICLLGNIRYFLISEYQLLNKHQSIFLQNFYYSLGICIGLFLCNFYKNWLLVFLAAELFSLFYSFFNLKKRSFIKRFNNDGDYNLTNIVHLILNNGVSYSLLYYDRFVIYPFLGANKVSLYYSASVTSKIGSLVISPISNYLLGKLGRNNEVEDVKVVNMSIVGSIIIIICYFLMGIIITPILITILYPEFLLLVQDIIIPLCLGTAIMGGVTLLKPVIMRYISTKYYNKMFIIYGTILVTFSIILCLEYSLFGIAIANVITSTILYVLLLIKLIKYKARSSV